MNINIRLRDMVEDLPQQDVAAIEKVLDTIGCTLESTPSEMLDALVKYPDWNKELSLDENKAVMSIIFPPNKFGNKLTFEQRCEILALYRAGIQRELLAKIYGIDPRTVTHIYNAQSPHYKNVRQEEHNLGLVGFQKKYLNQSAQEKALMLQQMKQHDKPVNNKYSNTKAGLHIVRGAYCTYDHRVIIEWQNEGWYYRDLDGDMPEQWFLAGGDEASCRTSQACFAAMLKEITDKLE
jgi:hypothetical protein